jgi:hypothetical protein
MYIFFLEFEAKTQFSEPERDELNREWRTIQASNFLISTVHV